MYILKDGDGDISRARQNPTPDSGEIEVPDDNAELLAFLNPPEPPPLPTPRALATVIADAIDAGNTGALRTLVAQFPE